ncbi:tyrosine-type recombinase/integrase [Alphaproteobacteria bacterium HT1-32]|nr:tyrosine-type recombinase/integrase [Alphaproteobacteria bacterium HT1-32]
MSDIRKRTGKKGTTYQVRYPSKATKSGYAFKTFSTLKEAREFIESGSLKSLRSTSSNEKISVEEGLQRWLDICEKEGRDGRDPVTKYTLKIYEYRRSIIEAYGWDRPLNEITTPDVVEFRSWLLRHYSRDQAKKALSSFHSMVLEMVKRGYLQHDIAAGISVNGASRYDQPIVIPTVDEVRALLSAADRLANSRNLLTQRTWERYRPMLYLAADSGMRPQEYIVVPRSNIRNKGVEVDRALELGGGISVTKTRAGRRFIDLSQHTYDMIRHYSDNHPDPGKHDLVFPTKSGKWQSTNNWRRRGFYAACVEASLVNVETIAGREIIKPKFKPYDLRHFFASVLIEKRCNLKRLQTLMGHSDIQTTLNVYGHLIERAEVAGEENHGMLDML